MKRILFLLLLTLSVTANAQVATKDDVYSSASVDVHPEYPGGVPAFYAYVNKNFKMPDIDKDMVAKIYISFVVERDGSISSVKIIKDPGYGLGAEAVRVIRSNTEKWTPGMQNGKAVRAQYNLPIIINIKGDPVKPSVKTE